LILVISSTPIATALARASILFALACTGACSGHGPSASETPDAFGASFQGDGVQCGAIVCTGSQQCCFVDIPTDANSSAPTHKCDQGCESVCMDECPEAGSGMSGMGGKPGMGSMPAMGGMAGTDAMAGMGGMAATDAMAGMGGMSGMASPPHGGSPSNDAAAHP
jgi:hypothetical protein